MHRTLPVGNQKSIPEGHLPFGIDCEHPLMGGDKYDVRQAKLRELLTTKFDGSQRALADAIQREASYISRVLSTGKNRKNIAEDLAREIERKLVLPELYLDGGNVSKETLEDAVTLYNGTDEAGNVGRLWDRLPEPVRTQMRVLIETLAFDQAKRERERQSKKVVELVKPRPSGP